MMIAEGHSIIIVSGILGSGLKEHKTMELFQVDDLGRLYISSAIDDWNVLDRHGIDTVIDLDGGLDSDVPELPDHWLYVYFPIFDEDLPNLHKLHAITTLNAT